LLSTMDVQPLVNFYLRKGYTYHARVACESEMRKRAGDPVLSFWRAVCLALELNFSEALRELERLRPRREVELAVLFALVDVHGRSKMPDRDAIAQARSLLPDSESRASPDALTLAGTFLWHAGSPDEARRLLDKAIASRQPTPQAFAIRGWIDAVHKPRTRKELLEVVQPSYEFFEQALSEGSGSPYHLDALMGMAYYHERKRKYGDAADTLTEAIAAHEWFLPALTEKARVLVLQGDWDQALEVAQRAIAAQPQCVDALVITAMAAIAREGDQRQGEHMLSLLLDALDRREPSNGDLYHRTAAAFARLVGRRSPMLHITQQMLDRASSVNPSEASHMSERGHQKLLQGDLRGALAAFGQATQLDEGNLQAVYGTILCQVEQGQLDDAEQQLEFLTVIQESLGESPMLFMLQALLQHRKHGNASQHVALLDRALQLHWEQLKTKKAAAFSLDWVAAYNPSFLMDVARELPRAGMQRLAPKART